MNYCRKCGSVIEPEDKYCKACGCAVVNDLVSPENTEEETNALQPVTSSVTTPVSQKTKHIKIIPIVITASAITAAIVLTAIFYKPVLSLYYNYKADSATEDTSKLLYSVKSIKIYPNKNSRNTLKMLLTNPKSQEKFNIRSIMSDFSSSLSKTDYKDIFSSYILSKFRNSINNSDYVSALYQLKDMKDLGLDFKKEKGYKDMMQYEMGFLEHQRSEPGMIATEISETHYSADIDNDGFDEIFTVNNSQDSNNGDLVTVYKYKDGITEISVSKKFEHFAPALYYSEWYRINNDSSTPTKLDENISKFKYADFYSYNVNNPNLDSYFRSKNWYKPKDNYKFDKNNLSASGLNDIEISNYKTIQKHLDALKPGYNSNN